MLSEYSTSSVKLRNIAKKLAVVICGAVIVFSIAFSVIYAFYIRPPKNFPIDAIVSVEQGSSLYILANKLYADSVIRSPFWFRAAAIAFGGERAMKAGEYYMPEPENTLAIAWRLLHGEFKLKSYRITIPEGFTTKKISTLFDDRFPFFDNELFESLVTEGYLFPDTYFIQESATASSTITMLSKNFDKKISKLMPEVESSGRTLDEIIIMASILEGEAKTREDMAIVSDILWKRLKIGMPLQVDTSFVYVLGKSTKDLTLDDLKFDSPYNTYLFRGLPPTPISNPGLDSIYAALNPTPGPYLYFLTANDGTMHYSKTFEEHVAKKHKYLRN